MSTTYPVDLTISNASYTQASNGERNFKFDVNYSIRNSNSSILGTNVDLYIQFSTTGGVNTQVITLLRTLSTTSYNGVYPVNVFDNPSYSILPNTTMRATAFMWYRNQLVPISYTAGTEQTIPSGTITTIPTAPVLSVTSINSWDKTLSWTSSFGATEYNLERSTGNTTGFSSYGDTSQRSADISHPQDLTTTYYYRVRAKNSIGYSPYSNVVSVSVPSGDIVSLPLPNPPVLSGSIINSTEQSLSWTQSLNSATFEIERADEINSYTVFLSNLTSLGAVISELNVPHTYYYRIRAQNSAGFSNYSNVITLVNTGIVTPPPPTVIVPAAPVISSRTAQGGDPNNDIEIFFTPISTATAYNLEISSPNYPNFITIGDTSLTPINGEIIFPITLSQGFGNYQYKVRAKNSAGYSGYSNIVTVTKTQTNPTDPQTQQVFQISTPNNSNTIRGTFNTISSAKWIYDNTNSLLCNYPEFTGLNVPCSLSYYIIPDILVSEPDNFASVIEQIRLRYLVNNPPPPTTGTGKNLISLLTGIFSMGLGLTLLGNKK